jgi:hypothetical protein
LAVSSVCRFRQADWRWAPGKAFIWASTVIMAVPVKSSPPCTVKGHKPLVTNGDGIFSGSRRQTVKLGYN